MRVISYAIALLSAIAATAAETDFEERCYSLQVVPISKRTLAEATILMNKRENLTNRNRY